MGVRMTMVSGTEDGRFELLCYEGDDCIWEQVFEDEDGAARFGARYLDGEFRDGFPMASEAHA